MQFTVAIAGRPNVGKSTLFNRLIGKRMAMVSDEPGVTRDWREGEGSLMGLHFRLLDTAGLEDIRAKGSLSARTAERTKIALDQTNVILLVVDARAGVTSEDKSVARELRKSGKPVILIGNKCEGNRLPENFDDFSSLGFGEPIAFSAVHGDGLADLHESMLSFVPADADHTPSHATEEDQENATVHIAVVGRPNAGKSTLINQLLGEERMLTGPEPGLTRDAIPIAWHYRGTDIRLVDTAGMRRRSKVTEKLERMSVQESLRAVRLAHVVILVVDAEQPFDKQDLIIAHHVVEEGRALIVAVNKWDNVEHKREVLKIIREKADVSLAQVAGVALVPVSALNGEGIKELMKAVLKVYETWNTRISTGKLNRWLETVEAKNPPPITQGRRLKLRYMTQVKSRPPTFSIWINKPVDLPESYLRFLSNGIRETFKLYGVPLRWQLKKGANPYDEKKD